MDNIMINKWCKFMWRNLLCSQQKTKFLLLLHKSKMNWYTHNWPFYTSWTYLQHWIYFHYFLPSPGSPDWHRWSWVAWTKQSLFVAHALETTWSLATTRSTWDKKKYWLLCLCCMIVLYTFIRECISISKDSYSCYLCHIFTHFPPQFWGEIFDTLTSARPHFC